MSHLCDSTVAGPTARRDNVLASKCKYSPFHYPPPPLHVPDELDVLSREYGAFLKNSHSAGPLYYTNLGLYHGLASGTLPL